MAENGTHEAEERQAKRRTTEVERPHISNDSAWSLDIQSAGYSATLLRDPGLNGRGNSDTRAGVMHSAQRTHGNRAVQRYLGSMSPGQSSRTSPIYVQRYEIGFKPGAEEIHQMLVAESMKKAGMLGQGDTHSSPGAQEYSRGVMWNDDPNSLLMKQDKFAPSYGGMLEFGNKFLGYEDEAVRRMGAGEKGFGPGEDMLARTHFGDLQFLHGLWPRAQFALNC